MSKLTEQMTIRLTAEQRQFLQRQAASHRGHPLTPRISEADVLRACIQYQMTHPAAPYLVPVAEAEVAE